MLQKLDSSGSCVIIRTLRKQAERKNEMKAVFKNNIELTHKGKKQAAYLITMDKEGNTVHDYGFCNNIELARKQAEARSTIHKEDGKKIISIEAVEMI